MTRPTSRRTVLTASAAAALITTTRLPPASAMTSDGGGSSSGGDRSLSFDGNGGYLLVANDGALDRGEAAITVEWWQRLDVGDRDLATWYPQVFDLGVTDSDTSGQLGVYFDGRTPDGLKVLISDGYLFSFPLSVSGLDGAWTHLAIVRDGVDLRAYRDGTLLGSYDYLSAMPIDSEGAALAIGTEQQAIASPGSRTRTAFSGLITDLRISSSQRYLGASFTRPSDGIPSDADTLLLLSVDDPFTDAGPASRTVTTETVDGSVPVASTTVPYGP